MAPELPNQSYIILHPPLHLPPLPPPPPCPQFINFLPPPPDHRVLLPGRIAINPAFVIKLDQERTKSLLQFMKDEGLVPSVEEEEKRSEAIHKLQQIVLVWIKEVARQRRYSDNIDDISATVLTYGSYGLGVHGPDSDIDALCAGPFFATMAEDFFNVLRNILLDTPEVSDIHCVKDAKVPLMRFKFKGISIDLPYARLRVSSVTDGTDIFSPNLLRNIDETSRKSLSGVRANRRILQLVPSVEKFQSVLRCLKLWAKRRGVYCNLVGFFGGIHIMVLTAYICQRYPNASVTNLISFFFETFASWPWPYPVILEVGLSPLNGEGNDTRHLMPIQLPSGQNELCHSNVTRSTFEKIRMEFLHGRAIARQILRQDFQWSWLFEPFPYAKKYIYFLRICLSASHQEELGNWVGWVKSRFRSLLLKVEEVLGFCDPNPTEYMDMDIAEPAEPNIVFYWGLHPVPSSCSTDVELIGEYFMNHLSNGCQHPFGSLQLAIVDSRQLPKEAQIDSGCEKVEPKAYGRNFDHNQLGKPIYSQMPNSYLGCEG